MRLTSLFTSYLQYEITQNYYEYAIYIFNINASLVYLESTYMTFSF